MRNLMRWLAPALLPSLVFALPHPAAFNPSIDMVDLTALEQSVDVTSNSNALFSRDIPLPNPPAQPVLRPTVTPIVATATATISAHDAPYCTIVPALEARSSIQTAALFTPLEAFDNHHAVKRSAASGVEVPRPTASLLSVLPASLFNPGPAMPPGGILDPIQPLPRWQRGPPRGFRRPGGPPQSFWDAIDGGPGDQAKALQQGPPAAGAPKGPQNAPTATPEAGSEGRDGPVTPPSTPVDVDFSSPLGGAIVHNNCGFAVNSEIVHGARASDDGRPEQIFRVLQPGSTQSHPFDHDLDLGVSWKLWRDGGESAGPVQLEWTYVSGQARTYWDLSMINAGEAAWLDGQSQGDIVGDTDGYGDYVGRVGIKHAFADEGMTLTPVVDGKDATQGNCQVVKCPPGESFCTNAYNTWNDWGQQHDCPAGVSIQLSLCG